MLRHPEVVRELDKQLTAAGKRQQFHTYPEAQHAFVDDTRPEVYDAAAAAYAKAKTLSIVQKKKNPRFESGPEGRLATF